MKIRRWQEGDLDKMPKPRSSVTDETLAAQSVTFTITTYYGVPVLIMGFLPLWEGCAQVWAIPSEIAKGRGLRLVRFARVMLSVCAAQYSIHRYHTLMNPQIPEDVQWIRLLGFHYESTFKRAYADGRELDMYVRFFGGEDNGSEQAERTPSGLQSTMEKLFNVE